MFVAEQQRQANICHPPLVEGTGIGTQDESRARRGSASETGECNRRSSIISSLCTSTAGMCVCPRAKRRAGRGAHTTCVRACIYCCMIDIHGTKNSSTSSSIHNYSQNNCPEEKETVVTQMNEWQQRELQVKRRAGAHGQRRAKEQQCNPYATAAAK